ncbi:putative Ig domain-containing protein,BNR/Asp-box repeat protein [Rheinheimera sp. A13L]|uniref:Ig-like domain-containing protein n=1 Tax=Rheinheimera sp. A13L TaxID=506534 RepID=UPI0002125056|nr:Ig-like domain-containing protein [Rheinheimera sp. A13L]EGM76015.1 putative Ig domain-containing protein,BNR/Asp-box repeat protein [Rheinheimera sp. A13L]
MEHRQWKKTLLGAMVPALFSGGAAATVLTLRSATAVSSRQEQPQADAATAAANPFDAFVGAAVSQPVVTASMEKEQTIDFLRQHGFLTNQSRRPSVIKGIHNSTATDRLVDKVMNSAIWCQYTDVRGCRSVNTVFSCTIVPGAQVVPSCGDTTPPTATIVVADTALRIGETSLVTITFSEAVVGFTNADLTIANGTLTAVSSSDGGITWTATLTPSASTTDATNLITLNNTGVADAAGNAGVGTTNSNNYAIDTVRPTASIVLADTALRIGETSLVTITFNEAVTGFTNADLTIANGTLTAVSSIDGGITWTATFTPTASITDATNLIVLDNTGVADAAGNAGTGTTNSNNYAIDTARPTATIVVADSALGIGETSLVTFTFSEAVTGFTNADLTIANGTLTAVSSADGGITWTATFTPTASITVATNVITLDNTGVADAAGNAGTGTTNSNNYAIDSVRPTASIVVADNSLTVGETSLVTFTFSEAVTGFNNADLTIANGTLTAVSSSDGGITWTATLTPTASVTDATNLITLNNTGVADTAGNAGTGTTNSNNYAIDTVRPTASIVLADTALRIGETSLVTFTFNEAVTGFTNADLTIANGTLTAVSSADGGITWTATFTPTASTTAATNVITLNNTGVADAAGNAGTGTTNSNNYAIDTARPTATIVVADSALGIGETSLVTFTFSEAVTGFTNADLTIANGTLTAVSSADGGITWTATFTPTASITVATNVITLDNTGVADAAGNAGTGTTNSNNYAIDSVRPTASIVVADNSLTVGETSLVTITFSEAVTGFNNDDLTIANGTLTAVSSADGGITWTATLTPTASVTDATNLITLNNTGVADTAGNAGTGTTNSNNYAIDTVRPTASIVLADTALRIGETSLVTFTFNEAVTGFTNADLTIANGTLSAVSSGDGGITWTATFTPAASTTAATNVITLNNTGVADAAGNAGTGTTNSNNYAIDTARPTASIVVTDTALAIGETSLVTFTFSEAVAGFTNADLTIANGTLTAVSSGDGGITWTATFTPTASITAATNVITLDNTGVADAAGNAGTGTTNSNNYAIDGVRPTASIVVADNALSAGETSLVTFTFSEAVTGFNNADLTIANGTLTAVSSSDGGVTWTATFTPTAGVTNATNVITLNNTGVADTAGNAGAGTTNSNNYAIDTVRPTASIVLADTALRIGETSLVTFTFSEAVSGFTNADLTIANGTLTAVSSIDGGITWTATFTPSASTTAATNVITLNNTGVADAAGNTGTGTTNSNNYAIDTEAPNAPSVPDLAAGSDSGSSSTDNITNVTTPTFTGTAEPNSTVEVFAGATSLGTVVANGGGAWSLTVAGGSALTDGTYSITATATDTAGNQALAPSAALSVTIDTTAPVKPAAPDLAAASDTGSSNSDNLTNATSLVFNGTAEDGSTVSLNSSVNNALGTATAAGGSWSLTTAAVTSEGLHNITLTATDLAGNVSVASDPLAITLDKTPPAIGGVAFDQGSVTSVNQAALSFTLAGAEVGATANYSISSSNGGTAVTNTFAVVSAGQQVTGLNVSGLNDGLLTASLTLTDAAGNSNNPAVTATVNKDANVPTISSVAIANGNYKAGDTVSFSLTFNEALVLSGANSDYSLAVDIGGVTRQALLTSNAAGVLTFSYTVQAGENTAASGVAIASNALSLLNGATIKDAGNNDATLSFGGINNSAAKVDTTAPTLTVVTDPAQAVFVNAANYQIKGTHAEIGLTINLYTDTGNDGTADGGVLVSAVVDADGNWSLVQPLVADSAHNYVVIAEDAAGNVSAAVDVPTITEDSIAPVAPAVTSPAAALAVNTLSQLISGTHTEDGVRVELFADADNDGVADNSTVLASAEVGVVTAGSWSLTAPLTQNTANNFVVIAKDKAANVSAAVDVVTVTQDSVAPVVTVTALATADSTPALAGTVDDTTATLSLVVNGQTYTPTNNGTGGWNLADNQIAALPHGVYDVVVTATDTQGNVGTDASTNELTIDLLPPSGYSVVIQQNRIDAANQAAMSFVFAGAEVGSTYTYVVSDGTNSVTNTGVVTAANQQIGSINVTGLAEGTLQLSVILTDTVGNAGAAATATVVKLYNATPVISGSPATSVNEDSLYSFTPVATDTDAGTTFTFSISNKPVWASFNTATGALTGTPTNEHVGITSGIVISVSDGLATASLPAFAITVVNVNDAPVVTSTPVTSATQGSPYSYSFTATDVDVGDTLTRSVVNKPVWLNFNTDTGVLSGTPGNADVGVHTVTLRVTDAAALFADQSFNVTVANINDAPTISGAPAVTIAQGAAYSFVPTAADVDPGTTLTFSIANKPTWASFNTATGALTGTPGNADVGATAGIVISVSDGELSAALPAFTLTVTNVNDAPTITGTPAVSIAQGATYSFVPTAADVDPGTTLTFSIANKPTWASFNTATGALTGTPGNADVGATAGIVISVSDGELSAALPAFTLTVTNVNDAPTISGTPAITVAQGAAYSFVPTAADVDPDTTLTFSIANKPAWAAFNTATGALTGTPANADVGVTAGIVISVSDGELSAALPAFTLTVTNVNDAPVVADRSATTEEDTPLSLTLTAQDPDQDPLTFEIVTQPEHGTATLQGTVLVYTPEQDFNGTDSIAFVAKDADLTSAVATITLTVTAVNDDPVVQDDSYNLQRTDNNQYLLNVLANDTDVDGDTLTIDGASTTVGTVTFNENGLTLTAPDRYVGPVTLRYTVTDGNGGRDNADVNLIIEGGVASDLPVITVPADIEVNATALFTRVPIGTATAVDRNGRRLRVSLINGSLFFAPGEHIVYWQATDAAGNTATKAQKISVNPLISLSKDQLVTEGSDVVVEVILNGPSPVYPVLVPYTVSGSANGNDHTLVSGVAEISSGLSTNIRFTVLEDGQSEGTEDIVISLDASVNRGSQRTSRIVVTEANIAPVVSLTVQQNSESRLTVGENDGLVTVTATVTDANQQDQVSGEWNFGRLDNVTTDQTQLSFDPAEQGPGLYQVSYTATDNGTPNLSATNRVFIVVRPSLPVLGSQDSDGDLIPDDQEGFADSDGDGIPDYLDAINECNVMPTELLGQTEFVAEGDPGVCLRLGTIAAETDAGGLQIAQDAIEEDEVAVNIGGIFDFIAYGLPEQGQSYSLVIPQRLPVPANAVYRKFNDATGWVDFVSNERNSVASTQGERGFCPPPGDAVWTQGLTEGHWCVQVTVEDGGPNDADGIANSAIVDPGGVAVELNGNNLPVAVADQASTRLDTAVEVNVLANDTDPDGDTLTVNQAVGSFGTVTILDDQQLNYMPNPDFIGTDIVIYSITDGKGGTASSELVVSVVGNVAPVAVNDTASTDDKTVLLIAVLANDSDEDGNTLMVSSASAEQGSVSIEADQRLRYTPKAGFDGVDTISYTITDGFGGQASAQVSVTVRAYQDVVVDNKSSGGSMAWWMVMVLAGAVVLRRRSVLGLAAVALLSFSPFSQSADWYLQGSIGHSKADQKQSRLVEELPNGTITGFDDSDGSFGVNLGYQLHPVFALELGYLDLGEASSQISAESLTPQQYHELVKAVTPVLVDGFTVGGRFTLWQNEQWAVEVPLGLMFWKSDIESRMDDSVIRSDSDGVDLVLGVQLNYQLTEKWTLGVGFQQFSLKPNDVNSWLVSLRTRF